MSINSSKRILKNALCCGNIRYINSYGQLLYPNRFVHSSSFSNSFPSLNSFPVNSILDPVTVRSRHFKQQLSSSCSKRYFQSFSKLNETQAATSVKLNETQASSVLMDSLFSSSKSVCKPIAMSQLAATTTPNSDWLKNEIPGRYLHIIRLLSMKPSMEPIFKRYLEDAAHLSTLIHTQTAIHLSKNLTRLQKRAQESADLMKNSTSGFMEQFLSTNYGLQVLLEEYANLIQGKNTHVVNRVNVSQVVQEAASKVLKEQNAKGMPIPEITIINVGQKPITMLYIPDHLSLMVQDLIRVSSCSCPDPTRIVIVVACGKEDISIRVTPSNDCEKNTSLKFVSMQTKVMARYWGGSVEEVKMGQSVHRYLHLACGDSKERIPPLLETFPAFA